MGAGSSTNTSQTQNQSGTTTPWAPAVPYLTQGMSNAQNFYNQNVTQGPYQGNYVAPTNAPQYNAAANAYNGSVAWQPFVDNQANTGVSQTNAGTGAQNTSMGGLANFANSNQTDQNIANANQYTQGFDVPGQVAAAMQGANQEAANVTLPSLYRGAAAEGNINSDRTAISDGLVRQGLDQQAAGLTAQLNNSNYQNGLNLSQNGNTQQLAALSGLGTLGSTTAQQGNTATNSGINNQGVLDGQGITGSNQLQTLDQSNLNNQIQKYQGNQNFGYQQLASLMGILNGARQGGGSYTGTSNSTGTTQNNPSMLSTIGSGAGMLGSLASLFG